MTIPNTGVQPVVVVFFEEDQGDQHKGRPDHNSTTSSVQNTQLHQTLDGCRSWEMLRLDFGAREGRSILPRRWLVASVTPWALTDVEGPIHPQLELIISQLRA